MSADLTNLLNKPTGYYQSSREDMLKYIPQGTKTTLELGCGTGRFSSLLKENLDAETWAVEIDKESAEKAAQTLHKVINKDAAESVKELPENYFDCILFFDILEHLVDPYSLLSALKSNLTKKGVIVASIPNIRYYRTLVDFIIHGNWDYEDEGILDKTHLRFFTKKSIIKTFDKLDFEILTLEGIHPTHSRTFKLLNLILLNSIADVRYKHFCIIARPKPKSA